MKQIISRILFLALLLAFFSACKTVKTASSHGQAGGKQTTETKHTLTPSEMVVKVQQGQPAFRTANVKKMSLFADVTGRQKDVKATCKIVSDSAIHLSIQPFFGVELFKLELTPKTLTLIDKLNRTYYVSNYSIFKEKFGFTVNYDAIQSIISNRLFVAGNKVFLPADFKWKNDTLTNTLVVEHENIHQETALNLMMNRISDVLIKTTDSAYTMKVTYSDFKNFGKTLFSANIFIDADNTNSKAALHFTIEDVEFDKPLVLEPTNLARYQPGDIRSFFRK